MPHLRGKNADNTGWRKYISGSNPNEDVMYWITNDTRNAVHPLELDLEKKWIILNWLINTPVKKKKNYTSHCLFFS